jgi:hypothetical protein
VVGKSIAVWSGRSSSDSRDELGVRPEFNLNDPAERQRALESIDHELMREEIVKTPRDSRVCVVIDFDQQFQGTIVSASPERVELMNCIFSEVVPGPDGQQQCKTSHVPYVSVEIEKMTRFLAVTPPPANFDSRETNSDSSDSVIDSIVLLSGHSQRLGQQPSRGLADKESKSPEGMRAETENLPQGSQICIVDVSGHRFDGTVLSAGPEGVELMNCIWREVIPGQGGQKQIKTSHVAFQSFKASSIASCAIISPAPDDFVPPELGVDCEQYIVAEFIAKSGCRHRWAKPSDRATRTKTQSRELSFK